MTNEKKSLITEWYPHYRFSSIRAVHQGWDNDIFIANNETVFRFPKRSEVAKRVEREKRLIGLLQQRNPSLPVPSYQLHYKESELLCVSYEYITGNQLSVMQEGTGFQSNEVPKILGEFLSELHAIDLATANTIGLTYERDLNYWTVFYEKIKQQLYPLFSDAQRIFVSKLYESFLNTHVKNHPRCAVHGDLTASNILYDGMTGSISGIIDFTDAMIGDPAIDFAGFYWDFGPQFTKQVIAHYAETEGETDLFLRVEQFYGMQPLFYELLHAHENNLPLTEQEALLRLRALVGQ